MNLEAALKLQAWIDGETPGSEAPEIAAWARRDAEAGTLATELRRTRSALREGEPEHRLPVSREFYWAGIQRQIERAERPGTVPAAPRPLSRLVRFLIPATVLGALALALLLPGLRGVFSPANTWGAEVESPLDDLSSVTFRSESEGMTVVWVNTR